MKQEKSRQDIRTINQAMKFGGAKIKIDEKRQQKYMHSAARKNVVHRKGSRKS